MFGRGAATKIDAMTPARLTAFLLAAVAGIGAVALALRPPEPELTPAAAAELATGWVGAGTAQPPRRDGGEWEVDVTRPDGSLVEVTVGQRGELLGLDEEGAPVGRAPDELTGRVRTLAVRAAVAAAGPGRVLSAERELGGGIEVSIRRRDGSQIEVGLDRRLRAVEIEREDPGDE
jgi:hypothetical protein